MSTPSSAMNSELQDQAALRDQDIIVPTPLYPGSYIRFPMQSSNTGEIIWDKEQFLRHNAILAAQYVLKFVREEKKYENKFSQGIYLLFDQVPGIGIFISTFLITLEKELAVNNNKDGLLLAFKPEDPFNFILFQKKAGQTQKDNKQNNTERRFAFNFDSIGGVSSTYVVPGGTYRWGVPAWPENIITITTPKEAAEIATTSTWICANPKISTFAVYAFMLPKKGAALNAAALNSQPGIATTSTSVVASTEANNTTTSEAGTKPTSSLAKK